jgi:hypothetical protein
VIEVESTDLASRPSIAIWLDHTKGMCVLRYEARLAASCSEMTEVEELASVKTAVGDMWYPRKAVRLLEYGPGRTIKYQIVVHNFTPNMMVKDADCRLSFPVGSRVFDKKLLIAYNTTSTGSTEIYDMRKPNLGKLLLDTNSKTGLQQISASMASNNVLSSQPADLPTLAATENDSGKWMVLAGIITASVFLLMAGLRWKRF